MPLLSWRRATDLWLSVATDQQLPSGSQSRTDLRVRSQSEGVPTIDATSRGNGRDMFPMSSIRTSSPLSDEATGAPDLRPQNTEGPNEHEPYDVRKGSVRDVWARMPKDIRRWEKPANTPVVHMKIPAGSLTIANPPQPLPDGWTIHTHPEGKPYYHRDAREPDPELLLGTRRYGEGRELCKALAIVTDSDPRDPLTRKLLVHAHFIAQVTIKENNVDLPERVELFLELYPADEPDTHPYAGYYLVDHDNQMIFWGAPSSTSELGACKVNPETFSNHHLKLQMTQQYWHHVQCYPLNSSIRVKLAQRELLRQLSIMRLDTSTSTVSTSDYSEEQCERFQSMLQNCPASCKTWMVARLMTLTMHWQFINLYGHPSARLVRHHAYEADGGTLISDLDVIASEPDTVAPSPSTSVTDVESQIPKQRIIVRSQALVAILLRLCCLLLFDAPAKHNEELQRIWVDKIVNQMHFQELIDRTLVDWERVSLLSTVLWTANIGFLAILNPLTTPPSITTFDCIIRRVLVLTSLTSTVFSVGSITLGLLYIRKHRIKWTAEEAREYLEMEHHPLYGHRPLAILWALPFAFLMLSIVAFAAAILVFCVALEDLITEIMLFTLSVLMVAWIVISVWYFWKRETRWRSTLDGAHYQSFRMQFTNWSWGLPEMPLRARQRKTV